MQLVAPKNLARNFSGFPEKIVVQNFLVFQKNAYLSQKNFQTWEFMFIRSSPGLQILFIFFRFICLAAVTGIFLLYRILVILGPQIRVGLITSRVNWLSKYLQQLSLKLVKNFQRDIATPTQLFGKWKNPKKHKYTF